MRCKFAINPAENSFPVKLQDMHHTLKKIILTSLAIVLVPLLLLIFLASRNAKQSQQTQPCPSIQPALFYLMNQYNPAIGLLSEAPNAAPDTYWLNNDNFLAALAFQRAGKNSERQNIQASLEKYDAAQTDIEKILKNTPVAFPPHVSEIVVKWKFASEYEQIRDEVSISNEYFNDWDEYTNLATLAALNEFNKLNPEVSLKIFDQSLQMFDGIGFRDLAFDQYYETYKLAMAIYVGKKIGSKFSQRNQMINILLSLQADNGGFYTHYDANFLPAGDTNTETTAWSILALQAAGCYTGK